MNTRTVERNIKRKLKIPPLPVDDTPVPTHKEVTLRVTSATDQTIAQDPLQKKYNVKIDDHDLLLLDRIAESNSVTRASIINDVVKECLIDELRSITDYDKRTAIAMAANKLANSPDEFSLGWLQVALYESFQVVVDSCLEENYPNSDGWQFDVQSPSDGFEKLEKVLKELTSQ